MIGIDIKAQDLVETLHVGNGRNTQKYQLNCNNQIYVFPRGIYCMNLGNAPTLHTVCHYTSFTLLVYKLNWW